MDIAFDLFSLLCAGLGGLYAAVTLANLAVFKAPGSVRTGGRPVSILIPARDEAANIAAALATASMQTHAEIEILVLDDSSTDGTGDIARKAATLDPRIRVLSGAPLPAGWNGKQHACHQMSLAARHPVLLFLDADVRLAPDAVSRMLGYMQDRSFDLVSGFPRQITGTLAEKVVIPQILVLLLGYLPFYMARRLPAEGFAAACGQLMMVEAAAYKRAGGHYAFRNRMHDGLHLPRALRRTGGRTDILDATPLASVRMYDTWPDIREGFRKNATEGMANPVALPIWTVLLFGGHILPPGLMLAALAAGQGGPALIAGCTTLAVFVARSALAWKTRQSWISVALHPVGVAITLWIQWTALLRARIGHRAVWRGRSYDVH